MQKLSVEPASVPPNWTELAAAAFLTHRPLAPRRPKPRNVPPKLGSTGAKPGIAESKQKSSRNRLFSMGYAGIQIVLELPSCEVRRPPRPRSGRGQSRCPSPSPGAASPRRPLPLPRARGSPNFTAWVPTSLSIPTPLRSDQPGLYAGGQLNMSRTNMGYFSIDRPRAANAVGGGIAAAQDGR